MATLFLSMSVPPNGRLKFVYISESKMATLRFSISLTPKWSLYVCLYQ